MENAKYTIDPNQFGSFTSVQTIVFADKTKFKVISTIRKPEGELTRIKISERDFEASVYDSFIADLLSRGAKEDSSTNNYPIIEEALHLLNDLHL
jgi:hypothetical protein